MSSRANQEALKPGHVLTGAGETSLLWETVRSNLCEESRGQTLRRASRAQSEASHPGRGQLALGCASPPALAPRSQECPAVALSPHSGPGTAGTELCRSPVGSHARQRRSEYLQVSVKEHLPRVRVWGRRLLSGAASWLRVLTSPQSLWLAGRGQMLPAGRLAVEQGERPVSGAPRTAGIQPGQRYFW